MTTPHTDGASQADMSGGRNCWHEPARLTPTREEREAALRFFEAVLAELDRDPRCDEIGAAGAARAAGMVYRPKDGNGGSEMGRMLAIARVEISMLSGVRLRRKTGIRGLTRDQVERAIRRFRKPVPNLYRGNFE